MVETTEKAFMPDAVVAEGGESPSKGSLEIQPARSVTGIKWILVVICVVAPFWLFALDNTIVADVQPVIIATFGEIENLPWISVAFALGASSVNLVWGKLYSQFEIKTLFLVAILIFEVGSAVCGAAPNLNALIIGRAICGLGGSGLYLGCMNILSTLTTESERPGYLSLVGFMWGIGTVLGPIIGGAFAHSSATWRWAFYINLVIGGAAAPVLLFLLPTHDPRKNTSLTTRLNEIDFVGTVLFAGASCSGIMAISFGGTTYEWSSGQVIGMFVCSGVLWILFALQQVLCILTTATRRLFPVEMIKSWQMVALFILTACSITSCFLPIYFLPLYFQFARGDSALEAAIRLLPYVFILVFAVIFNGVAMGKLGYYMPFFFIGSLLVTAGSALMYTVGLDTSISRVYGYTVVLALGTGLFSQAAFPVAQLKVTPSQIPDATAFIGCSQISALAIALSVANALFINLAQQRIINVLPGTNIDLVRQAISGGGGSFFQSLEPVSRRDVLTATVSAIQDVYVMCIAAGALAVICAATLKRDRLFVA